MAGSTFWMGVVTLSTVGGAVSFHEITLLSTSSATSDSVAEHAVGGAG